MEEGCREPCLIQYDLTHRPQIGWFLEAEWKECWYPLFPGRLGAEEVLASHEPKVPSPQQRQRSHNDSVRLGSPHLWFAPQERRLPRQIRDFVAVGSKVQVLLQP